MVRVVRARPADGDAVVWDPDRGVLDVEQLAGIDAVFHLAGEPIGARRWTARQKARILNSRTRSTEIMARALSSLTPRPRVLVSASAMGFYGERGDEVLTEASDPGEGFLASVCRRWEASTNAASEADIRVVHLRTGLVLDPSGGLLKRILLPFRLGLGGRLASGRQWMSWITRDDHIRAMLHLLDNDVAGGPFNVCAPDPVRNDAFTSALAVALRRPALLPVPKALIAIPYGRELATDLLSSTRMVPQRLSEMGFRCAATGLDAALRAMLRL